MKKLIFLFCLIPAIVKAGPPPFHSSDPGTENNFIDINNTMATHTHEDNGTSRPHNWIPKADSTYDLGASGREWANLYVDTITASRLSSTTLAVSSNATVGGSLSVTGGSAFTGAVIASTNVRIGGALDVDGISATFINSGSVVATTVTSPSFIISTRSVTGTDTATTADTFIILSGASFTETLFSASGRAGKTLKFLHNGTSLSQVYVIDGASSETIGSSTTYSLYTNGEALEIISNGSNWLIASHTAETNWVNAGAITVTATTSNPTKGSTQSLDRLWWRRVGSSAHVRFNFRQTNASGSAAGTGDYLFAVPSNMTIDTNLLDVYATAEGWNGAYTNAYTIGSGGFGDGASQSTAVIVPYDSTRVRLFACAVGATCGAIGALGYALTNTNVWYTGDFVVPISGWNP